MNTGKTGKNRETAENAEIALLKARLEAAELRAQLAKLQGGNTRSEERTTTRRVQKPPRREAAAAARTERTEHKAPKSVELSEVFDGDAEQAASIRNEIVEYLKENKHTHKRAQVSIGKLYYDLGLKGNSRGVKTLAGFLRVYRDIFWVHVVPDREDRSKIFDTRVNLIVADEDASVSVSSDEE